MYTGWPKSQFHGTKVSSHDSKVSSRGPKVSSMAQKSVLMTQKSVPVAQKSVPLAQKSAQNLHIQGGSKVSFRRTKVSSHGPTLSCYIVLFQPNFLRVNVLDFNVGQSIKKPRTDFCGTLV